MWSKAKEFLGNAKARCVETLHEKVAEAFVRSLLKMLEVGFAIAATLKFKTL